MSDLFSGKSFAINDQAGFSILVDAFYGSLTAFAFKILGDRDQAEDIVQDVFVNLWIHRKKIDSETSLKNYLYVSTRNAAYNYFRKYHRLERQIINIPSYEDAMIYMIEEENNRILLSAIDQLPDNYSEVIRLGLEGHRQKEIAGILDIALPTVKSLKSRAIKRLKKIIEK